MHAKRGSVVTFTRPDGQQVEGYLATPDTLEGAPAVVVIQEWWGLNDQIRGVADRLARAGYWALVPDLYRGQSTVAEEEAHHLMEGLNFADAATQDIGGAVAYLKQHVARVAVAGYCMGGTLALLASANVTGIDATVVFYGFPPLDYIDASKITMPVLGHWATQDQFFPIATVDALEEKLRAANVDFSFHRYQAHHAFANETALGPNRIAATQYDSVWAELAWDRTFTFLGKNLWG